MVIIYKVYIDVGFTFLIILWLLQGTFDLSKQGLA
jgi:hypothetical protein